MESVGLAADSSRDGDIAVQLLASIRRKPKWVNNARGCYAAAFNDLESVALIALCIQHNDGGGISLHIDNHGPMLRMNHAFHDRHCAPAIDTCTAMSGDDRDGALVRIQTGAFPV